MFCGQSVEFGGLCEQSVDIAHHWNRFWQKSDQAMQSYVRLIREVCREDASQYFFIEYNDLSGASDKELMNDLALKHAYIRSNGEVECLTESPLVTTNHDIVLLFWDGDLVSASFDG